MDESIKKHYRERAAKTWSSLFFFQEEGFKGSIILLKHLRPDEKENTFRPGFVEYVLGLSLS